MTERINVKGHYRIVTRDSKGKFTSVKKWHGICRWGTTGSCALRYNSREECGTGKSLGCPLDKKETTGT